MTGVSGWVVFVLDGREMAGALDEVREVVRATGVETLTGTRAPVTGLLELRGTPIPVVDLRSTPPTPRDVSTEAAPPGDVLVLSTRDGVVGLAVDRVTSVLDPEGLTAPPGPNQALPLGLPSYVLEVRRDSADRAVLVVSLAGLAGLTA